MTITLNGAPTRVPDGISVAELLRHHRGDDAPAGIAVAVNADVVPQADWSGHRIVAGDAVEIVTAVQGG